ncbi:MAG TPA: membrane-binding protein [Chryseosolibacter sp.]
MKKLPLATFLFTISLHVAFAQSRIQLASEPEARHMVNLIVDVVGLKPNFTVKAGNVDNAAAVIRNGKRYILYNPIFIKQIKNAVKTDWGGMSILAHEVGHHLNGHTLLGSGSVPAIELEADEFAGFVLRRLGATLTESQAAMRLISDERDSRTHPARSKRLASIEAGWNRADVQIVSAIKPDLSLPKRETSTKRTSPAADENIVVSSYSFPRKFISYNLHFDALPAEKFYVTIQNNIVRVTQKGYQVVGSLVQSGKNYYLSFSSNQNLRVGSNGNVFDQHGSTIGRLSKSVRYMQVS